MDSTTVNRQPTGRDSLIHHGDRGVPYVSIRYADRLAEVGIDPSLGSVGDSCDNASAEMINGLYKAEVIHRRSGQSRETVELVTLDWGHARQLKDHIGQLAKHWTRVGERLDGAREVFGRICSPSSAGGASDVSCANGWRREA